MFLIHPSKEDIYDGLESWDWYDFTDKEPFAVTAFGDVFFEGNDGIYFLDKVAGEFSKICGTKSDLENLLNTQDGKDQYLMCELVMLARERGMILEDGECYEFKIAPFLSGSLDIDNLEKMSFKLSLNITGQLFKQVKDLPAGTQISEIVLKDS